MISTISASAGSVGAAVSPAGAGSAGAAASPAGTAGAAGVDSRSPQAVTIPRKKTHARKIESIFFIFLPPYYFLSMIIEPIYSTLCAVILTVMY